MRRFPEIPEVGSEDGKEYNFQSRALPFGLSSSLRIFTKLLAESLAPMRFKKRTIVPYLLLFVGPAMAELVGMDIKH